MNLDIGTLSVVTVFVTALLGALLVFAGLQNRSIRSPMWWGAAQIVGAAGLALATSRGSVPDFVAVDIAHALVLLGYGLTWAGARIFDGRKVQPLVVVFAPILGCSSVVSRPLRTTSTCASSCSRRCWRCWPPRPPRSSGAAATSR
jgi:hypothetical protein